MKKNVAAVALLAIAAAGAGMPALLGLLAQNRIATLTGALVDESFLRFAVTDYQRGWRSSRATIEVGLGDAWQALLAGVIADDLLDRTIDYTVDVTHGPVFTEGGVGIGLADAVIRADPRTAGLRTLLALLGAEDLGEVRTRIAFSSALSFQLTTPPMAVTRPEVSFASSGVFAQGTFDTARQRQVSGGRVDRIDVTVAGATLTAEDLTVALDLSRVAPYFWMGSTDLSVARMHGAHGGSGITFAADNLGASSQTESNEAGDRIDMTATYFADSMSADEVGIADARFDLALRNLDLDALTAYQELAFELAGTDPRTRNPEEMASVFEPIVYRFLTAEPELTFGPIGFNLNGGALTATVDIRLDNEMLPAQPLFTLLDSTLWPRLVSVEADLEVDRDLAQWIAVRAMTGTPGTLRPGANGDADAGQLSPVAQAQARGTLIGLVSQGMLEETESGYRFRGSYDNGVAEVNGSVLPLGPAARDIF